MSCARIRRMNGLICCLRISLKKKWKQNFLKNPNGSLLGVPLKSQGSIKYKFHFVYTNTPELHCLKVWHIIKQLEPTVVLKPSSLSTNSWLTIIPRRHWVAEIWTAPKEVCPVWKNCVPTGNTEALYLRRRGINYSCLKETLPCALARCVSNVPFDLQCVL